MIYMKKKQVTQLTEAKTRIKQPIVIRQTLYNDEMTTSLLFKYIRNEHSKHTDRTL